MNACSHTSITSSGLKPAGIPFLVQRDPVIREAIGHGVLVLEAETPRQLGEFRIRPRRVALSVQLSQLGIERIHLLDIAGVQLQGPDCRHGVHPFCPAPGS